MAGAQWKKAAALSISVLCAAVNLAIALQFVSLWHASWQDTVTESESIAGGWAKGVEALEGLAALYSLAATAANIVGLVGIVRRNARCVRFWRDFSIADFACSVTTIVLAVYAASRYYGLRSGVCEELSRHDEMVMELAEMGITLENCEQWSQHVLFAFVCSVIFLLLVRLHLIITVSKVFARRTHHSRRSSSMQHIYLLPNLPGKASPRVQATAEEGAAYMPAVVYAPIPLSSLSDADVRQISAREVWVSPTSVDMQPTRTSLSGRINLPIAPGEGLFPGSREKQ